MREDLIERLQADADLIHNNGITRKLPRHRVAALLREAAAALQRQPADADRVDAERYRWLRSLDGQCDAAASVYFNIGFYWIECHGDELDAAIDSARAGGGST